MVRNSNRPPRPSTVNNKNNIPCDMFVHCSSQGSLFGDDDTYSDFNTDFGSSLAPSSSGVSVFSDDDDDVFPKFWPPMDSVKHYAKGALDSDHLRWIHELKAYDEQLGHQSSDTNCFSFATSHGGATASASRNGPFSLETEEDAVDSLPYPLHQDENGGLNNHLVKCQSSEISNFYQVTTVTNDEAIRFNAIVDPQNIFNSNEMEYNEETSQPDEKLEIDNCKRKYEMSELICPFQSKKYLDHIDESNSEVITRNGNISNFPKERYDEEITATGSSLFLDNASRPSSSAGGLSISLELIDSHRTKVRFKVMSFTVQSVPEFFVEVPEFFVEVPETASVGFLKKAIIEKATAMVGDGGHLGVVHQSEDIGDENEILPKTGLSHQNKLGVIPEPKYIEALNVSSPHRSCVPWCTPLFSAHQRTTDTSPDSLLSSLGTIFHENHEGLEYRTDMPTVNSTSSMPVKACPAVNGALDLVFEHQKIKGTKCKKRLVMDGNSLDEGSVHQKSKSSMNVKRRKTEFFSISEVEALVRTAEELGTGRWQKIKEQAFGNDSRRTYMDVKDKWRSLVKTAKRPVDERRGVFLPQGLLDRVLAIETCKLR